MAEAKYIGGQRICDLTARESIEVLDERLERVIDGASSEVRSAIFNLLNHAVYNDYDATSDMTVVQSWSTDVTAVILSQTSASITGSGTVKLSASTSPAGGAITWASSNQRVATVDSSGLVTAVGSGVAIITASCGTKKASCTVEVSGIYSIANNLTNVSTNNSAASVEAGERSTALTNLYP